MIIATYETFEIGKHYSKGYNITDTRRNNHDEHPFFVIREATFYEYCAQPWIKEYDKKCALHPLTKFYLISLD